MDAYLERTNRPRHPYCTPSSSSASCDNGKAPVRSVQAVTSESATPELSIEKSCPTSISTQRSVTPPHELPSNEAYLGSQFEIKWHKLKYRKVAITGKIGYKVSHKKQFAPSFKESSIWEYGADLEWIYKGEQRHVWLCKICHEHKKYDQGFYILNGYDSVRNHLAREHRIAWDNDGKRIEVIKDPMQSKLAMGKATNRTTVENAPFDTKGYLRATLDWAIKQDLTYRQVTSQDTRDILSFDRPQIDSTLWQSHTTLSKYIIEAYKLRFVDISNLLQNAVSKIHLSCDIWTSTSGLSLLGIVTHFLGTFNTSLASPLTVIDENKKHRTVLIGLRRLFDRHSGVNIAICLAAVIEQYRIASNLGCLMADNASNNDTMVSELTKLIPSYSKDRRLFCVGHVINLIVKAALFGDGISKFERQISGASDQETFELWRQRGIIGRVHNIVLYIMPSDQRRQELAKYAKDPSVSEDQLFDSVINLVKDGGGKFCTHISCRI